MRLKKKKRDVIFLKRLVYSSISQDYAMYLSHVSIPCIFCEKLKKKKKMFYCKLTICTSSIVTRRVSRINDKRITSLIKMYLKSLCSMIGKKYKTEKSF